jgi:hypothetical protein
MSSVKRQQFTQKISYVENAEHTRSALATNILKPL